MTRLLEHTKQANCSKVICKHCEQDFNFKNKLHDHIREQHTQKSNLRVFAPESAYKIKKKSTVICSSVSFASFASLIFLATSKSIFCSASISESVSSKNSHLSIATLDITSKQTKIAAMLITRDFTSKRVKIAAFNCSLTFSISFSRTLVSKHQKSYLIIDDLVHMFREKSKSFDLHSHQKRRSFSRNSDTFYQSRIIVYFLSAVNQKTSISQSLKSSNSKSFQQHTFAKPIRAAFALSKKSIISSYKKSNIFYISLQSRFSFLQSRFSFLQSKFLFA